MKARLEGGRVEDVGGFSVGLSEYLSRWARWRLVCACVKELAERKRRGRKRSATLAFAGMVGVSRRSVERWLANGVQSCNVNAERIIGLSAELCPRKVRDILEEDLIRHEAALGAVGLRHGVDASVVEVVSE